MKNKSYYLEGNRGPRERAKLWHQFFPDTLNKQSECSDLEITRLLPKEIKEKLEVFQKRNSNYKKKKQLEILTLKIEQNSQDKFSLDGFQCRLETTEEQISNLEVEFEDSTQDWAERSDRKNRCTSISSRSPEQQDLPET